MTPPEGYALVTGGGGGIGRAFCVALAQQGWHVGILDIDLTATQQTLTEVTSANGAGEVLHHDVVSSIGWVELSRQLEQRWPRLDLLVNCAGILAAGEVGTLSLEVMQRVVEVNLLGTLVSCHALVPWMKAAETAASGGKANRAIPRGVINVASIFAALSPPGFAAYNASKAGVIALSESLRGELRPHGLGVTAVLPGVVPTGLFGKADYADERFARVVECYVRDARLRPEVVVRIALEAHRQGRLYAVAGRRARLLWRFKQLFPRRLIDSIARRTMRELHKCSTSR